MPEESELEKWARRQNESSRDAENTSSCFEGLFKVAAIGLLVVVIGVILQLTIFGDSSEMGIIITPIICGALFVFLLSRAG